jgi:hypothetical protein
MQFNLLSFKLPTETVTINLYSEKVEETHPNIVFRDELPALWEENTDTLSECKFLYCSFTNEQAECKGNKYTAEINLTNTPRFALNYIRHLIYTHFRGRVPAVSYNFVDGVEIWLKATQTKETTQFHKFTLNPQHARITDGFELLVTYDGISTVYNTPVSQLSEIQPELFSLVIAGGELAKYKKLTTEQKAQIDSIYPVLSHSLARALNLPERRELNPNKYISTHNQITAFCNNYLFVADFGQVLNIDKSGFIQVSGQKIFKTSYGSNTLLFSGNRTDIAPFNGLKNGPYQAPAVPNNNVRFFFIFHKNDTAHATALFNIFTKGLTYTDRNTGVEKTSFPNLAEYIKQPFYTDKNGSITFQNLDTAVQEVRQSLAQKQFIDGCTYVAIYISPIKKDDTTNPHHSIYFQIKETLLDKGITSQAIYKERHNDQYFSFHLPNIAIALLAKLGGIPWRLQDTSKDDLIVGVGAFRSYSIGKKYVGSAFCFRKDGVFQNFDCYRDNDLSKLVAGIRKALMHYVVEHETAERLIIHYYKTMSKKEAQPIIDMLYRLGLNIPVIVVTINKTETQDIVAFDTESTDLMPTSGTVVRVGGNQFLLYNSAKYDETFAAGKGKKDYPFPIKVKITTADKSCQFDNALFAELLDQVYKFSRMYWKSVKQQNLPITIKYPEMVAEIVPHFSDAELPPFGKTNLWFL